MKVYLDNCCLNRPFDDQREDAVRMEAEAVMAIISRCDNGAWEFCISDVLFDEIDNTPNLVRKQRFLCCTDRHGAT
ncbi:MAG: hypothetical protein LBH39_00730 [Clostridiales Family XIII bacterium]|nr:hypothetical protein [Clostridiales Family XIII bacterium]